MKGDIFGLSIAHLWVIEFQKRGLSHAQILITFLDGMRSKTLEDVDKMTSVELPPSPNKVGITEEEKKQGKLL